MDTYHPIKKALTWGVFGIMFAWLCGISFLISFICMGTGGLISGFADQYYNSV